MDWESWPAWITIIVAIVVPVITSVFTMRHERKMKKIDIVYNKKMEAIDLMCSTFHKAVDSDTHEDILVFSNAIYQVSIFFDKTITRELFDLLNMLETSVKGDRFHVIKKFRECMLLLGAEIHKQGKV